MLKNKIIILTAIFINYLIVYSFATPSCSPESYYSNPDRSLQEWIEISDWTVKVRITEIHHKWIPYENCYTEDMTKCNQRDAGTFKSEILNIMKGNQTEIKLVPCYCSKELPDKLGIYIFYGSEDGCYDGYEPIEGFIADE